MANRHNLESQRTVARIFGLELVRGLRTRNYKSKILVLSANLFYENIGEREKLGLDMMMSGTLRL